MDIADFAEKFMNVELQEWQKEHIRILEKLPRDAKIIVAPRGLVYIYVDQTVKENADVHTNERHSTNHSGYKSRVYVDTEYDRYSYRS